MGTLTPSNNTDMQKGNISSQSFSSIANVYLSKDSGRTEQLNTANAIIASTLLTLTIPKPDMNDVQEVKKSVALYFQTCAEKNVRPAISGICVALGITRQQFLEACETGQLTYRYAPSAISLPSDTWQFLVDIRSNYAAMIESMLETNLIHPSAGIFLLKNNCGYQDEITHNYNVNKTSVDLSALAEKYAKELEEN